jgi:hypothetical protein
MRITMPLVGAAAIAATLTACSSTTSGHLSGEASPTRVVGRTSSSTPPLTSATPAPATVPDACTLLTHAEAQALAGVKLNKGEDTPASSATAIGSCAYDAPVTGSSGSVQLFVQLSTPRALDIDKTLDHKFRTVPGIGDQTLEEPENASIFIHKGQVWVYLTVPYGATAKPLETAAAKIAARLP